MYLLYHQVCAMVKIITLCAVDNDDRVLPSQHLFPFVPPNVTNQNHSPPEGHRQTQSFILVGCYTRWQMWTRVASFPADGKLDRCKL